MIYVSQEQLDQVNYLLAQSALGNHLLFDDSTIRRVASRLGNTPAICRRSYVHPEIVGAYLDGTLVEQLKAEIEQELRAELSGLEPEEVAVLIFLQQRLARGEIAAAAT